MNVLPSSTIEDMDNLVDLVVELGSSAAQRNRKKGKVVLSTFGGGDCSFGGRGWEGFLKACRERGTEIYFIPAFFLPPEKILGMDYLDGVFNWNAAWPMGNYTTSSIEDRPFLKSDKAYMAAVSPWFFTHYGKTGDWAWNKNWIYRSDDHLYATRWMNILAADFDPEFIQIISWNDYGESHYIGPILGAQPGSERWTNGMSHEGWRQLTSWFIRRYKGMPLSAERETRVYLSYRLQPRDCQVEGDPVGRPDRADFAQDVISVTVTVPEHMENKSRLVLAMQAGRDNRQEIVLRPKGGIAMALVPFVSGNVSFRLLADGKELLAGQSEPIAYNDKTASLYNFNAWTGSWATQ
ncbi:hypothetical protein FFLO_02027 [Filobasidium floriforme]|uniref:Uncharacterized protein n=1 Tax=Filobasidium floriforme TaxID=5210 RepID=A0A8K0JNJ0_9TREE|nr:hypothetical protein FFLO_02027 [Filobasidium floriforme]